MRRSNRMKRILREHISTLALILTTFLALGTSAASRTEAEPAETHAKTQRVQDMIDDLRGRLSLRRDVVATLVPANPLMVSVRSPVEHGGAYQVAFEGSFVDTLSDDELRAVVAHELGHVWIFTHHPYLQTEQLAKQGRAAGGAARKPHARLRQGLAAWGSQRRARSVPRRLSAKARPSTPTT